METSYKIGYWYKAIDPCIMEDTDMPTLIVGKYYKCVRVQKSKYPISVIDENWDRHDLSEKFLKACSINKIL